MSEDDVKSEPTNELGSKTTVAQRFKGRELFGGDLTDVCEFELDVEGAAVVALASQSASVACLRVGWHFDLDQLAGRCCDANLAAEQHGAVGYGHSLD